MEKYTIIVINGGGCEIDRVHMFSINAKSALIDYLKNYDITLEEDDKIKIEGGWN